MMQSGSHGGCDASASPGEGNGGEEVLESRAVFEGSLLRVVVERVKLPDGTTVEREVVRHPGAAGALPIFRGGSGQDAGGSGQDGGEPAVLLIRQYRHAAARELWEIPAGTLERGEDARACALRELEEETGLRAGELRRLGTVHTSPGFTDERVHLFLAVDPEKGEARPEAEERIRSDVMPLSTALAMVEDGRVEDAKSVAALLLAGRATFAPSELS